MLFSFAPDQAEHDGNIGRNMRRIALGSIVVALVVLAIKAFAWWVTDSVALFSDALESVVNVVAGFVALWAITVSYKPADRDHLFGHTKAEYLSAVVEGVMIVLAALLILREAWYGFLAPEPIDAPALGLAINGVATILNAAWATFLIRQARSVRSPALDADGRHLFTDVFTSVGVIAGLALASATGWAVLDPIMAALVALNILREGYKVLASSLSGLMDKAVDQTDEQKIRELISVHAEGAIEVHDFKTRMAGRAIFIDFHLVVPGRMSVAGAHEICDRIEDALQDVYVGARVSIHVEPEHEAQQTGVPVL